MATAIRPIQIRGTAHPPPPRDGGRSNRADLSRAEIAATNIAGRPLLNEHDSNERVGTCLASWPGTDGSLRIAASVEEPNAIQQVRDGTLRGLSLGTDMVLNESGDVLYHNQAELSICGADARNGSTRSTGARPAGGVLFEAAAAAIRQCASPRPSAFRARANPR